MYGLCRCCTSNIHDTSFQPPSCVLVQILEPNTNFFIPITACLFRKAQPIRPKAMCTKPREVPSRQVLWASHPLAIYMCTLSILHFAKAMMSFGGQGLYGHMGGTVGSGLTPGSRQGRRKPEKTGSGSGNPGKPEKPFPARFALLRPN